MKFPPMKQTVFGLGALVLGMAIFANGANAAPILDGSNFGAPSATVIYDPAAPTSNFATPTNLTSGAAYDIYTAGDATYYYAEVKQNGSGGTSAGVFANLYFGIGPAVGVGSTYGIEVTNNRSFSTFTRPGYPPAGTYYDIAGTGIVTSVRDNGGTIEVAIPFSYFETDPQGIGFYTTSADFPDVQLRLSQSFGYSVAGGPTYGPNVLGTVTDPNFTQAVPEPASLAMLAIGLIGLGAGRLRRRA